LTKRKWPLLLLVGLILLLVSYNPVYLLIQEEITKNSIEDRYLVDFVDTKDGYSAILQKSEIAIRNHHIKITEEKTGKQVEYTPGDAEDKFSEGEIVKIQIQLDGKYITEPTEIVMYSKDRGGRYFSWLEVLNVHDKQTNRDQLSIIQRLSGDKVPLDDSKWRILHVYEDGTMNEELISFQERSEHLFGVMLITKSGTSLTAMGYYSNIAHTYPSLIYPLIYPWLTTIVGFLMIILTIVLIIRKNVKHQL